MVIQNIFPMIFNKPHGSPADFVVVGKRPPVRDYYYDTSSTPTSRVNTVPVSADRHIYSVQFRSAA
jgi:hypothetical protein